MASLSRAAVWGRRVLEGSNRNGKKDGACQQTEPEGARRAATDVWVPI
jgi:hypothetical protein